MKINYNENEEAILSNFMLCNRKSLKSKKIDNRYIHQYQEDNWDESLLINTNERNGDVKSIRYDVSFKNDYDNKRTSRTTELTLSSDSLFKRLINLIEINSSLYKSNGKSFEYVSSIINPNRFSVERIRKVYPIKNDHAHKIIYLSDKSKLIGTENKGLTSICDTEIGFMDHKVNFKNKHAIKKDETIYQLLKNIDEIFSMLMTDYSPNYKIILLNKLNFFTEVLNKQYDYIENENISPTSKKTEHILTRKL